MVNCMNSGVDCLGWHLYLLLLSLKQISKLSESSLLIFNSGAILGLSFCFIVRKIEVNTVWQTMHNICSYY